MNFLKLIAVSFILVLTPFVNAQNVKKDTVFNRSYNASQILSITTSWDDNLLIEVFHHNGILKSIEKFKANKLNGEQQTWFENGNIKSITNYNNGAILNYKEWYENGVLKYFKNFYQFPTNYPLKKSIQILHGEYKENYQNGVSKVKGYYDSGQRTGKWTEHYESGNKYYEGEYKYGLLSGKFKQWFVNGQIKSDNNYILKKRVITSLNNSVSNSYIRQGVYTPSNNAVEERNDNRNKEWESVMDGKQATYSELGNLLSLSHYKIGVKHGVFKSWNSNKQLLSWIEYTNGIVDGKNFTYYQDGKPHKLYHENANFHKTNSYQNFDKSYKTFYINGKPEVIGFYKNGKLHGTYTVYNINGNVISYSNFNNGLKVGEQIGYNAKGMVVSKSFYKIIVDSSIKTSVLDGESVTFYDNGILQSKGNYNNGKKVGIWNTWHLNGKLNTEIAYCNGLYCGNIYHYDNNGNITLKEKWKVLNNTQIKEYSKVYNNGNLYKVSYYNEFNEVIKGLEYNIDGSLNKIRYYFFIENKDYNGHSNLTRVLSFFDNGNIKSDQFYFDDKEYNDIRTNNNLSTQIGVEIKYYKDGSPMIFNNHSYFDTSSFNLFWDPAGSIVNKTHLKKSEVNEIYQVLKTKINAKSLNFDSLLFEDFNPFLNINKTTENKYDLILKYWNNKNCIELMNFNNNERGLFKFWSNAGDKIIEGETENGSKNGNWKYYNQLKNVQFESFSNQDTIYFKSYYTNNKLKESYKKVNGKNEGEFISYFENGIKQSQSSRKNNQNEGLHRTWFTNGVLEKEINYKQGNLNGESKEYWENGKLKASGIYNENYRDKVWIYYDSLGKPFMQMDFVNGQQNQVSFYSNCFCENTEIKIPEKLNPWSDLSNTEWFSKYYNLFSNNYNQSIIGFSGLNSSENKSTIKFNLFSNSRLFFKSQLQGFFLNYCSNPSNKFLNIPVEYHQYGNKDYVKLGIDRLSFQCSKRLIEPVELLDKNNNFYANGWYNRDKIYSELTFKVKDLMIFGDSLTFNNPSEFCFIPSYIVGTDILLDMEAANIVQYKNYEYSQNVDSADQYQLFKNYATNNVYSYGYSKYGIESQKAKFGVPLNLFDTSYLNSKVDINGMMLMYDNNLITSIKLDVLSNDKNSFEVVLNGKNVKFNIKDFTLNVYKKYRMRTSYNYIFKSKTLIIYLNKNNY